MAGGFSAVADSSRVAIERLDDRASIRIAQVELPAGAKTALAAGDVLRVFSAVDVAVPVQRQNKRVRIEGEVLRPGEYVLPPNSSIADALAAAGGMTTAAYPFGTEFTRESVRVTQQQNYDRALRDLETDLSLSNSTQGIGALGEGAGALAAREGANTRLLATLRAVRPSGRVVLQLEPEGRELPPLALEDGDRLLVPPRPTSVGVFGSVFNGGSYLFNPGRSLEDYLALAGGPKRGADERSTFVIRANGSVVSNQQKSGWFGTRQRPGRRARRAGRHHLHARRVGQDQLHPGGQGLDADPLPVRPGHRRHRGGEPTSDASPRKTRRRRRRRHAGPGVAAGAALEAAGAGAAAGGAGRAGHLVRDPEDLPVEDTSSCRRSSSKAPRHRPFRSSARCPGLAGAAAGIKTPADQYVALLQSATVADRLIEQFELMKVYDVEYRFKAREALTRNVRVMLGKKDGLITVEVEDEIGAARRRHGQPLCR